MSGPSPSWAPTQQVAAYPRGYYATASQAAPAVQGRQAHPRDPRRGCQHPSGDELPYYKWKMTAENEENKTAGVTPSTPRDVDYRNSAQLYQGYHCNPNPVWQGVAESQRHPLQKTWAHHSFSQFSQLSQHRASMWDYCSTQRWTQRQQHVRGRTQLMPCSLVNRAPGRDCVSALPISSSCSDGGQEHPPRQSASPQPLPNPSPAPAAISPPLPSSPPPPPPPPPPSLPQAEKLSLEPNDGLTRTTPEPRSEPQQTSEKPPCDEAVLQGDVSHLESCSMSELSPTIDALCEVLSAEVLSGAPSSLSKATVESSIPKDGTGPESRPEVLDGREVSSCSMAQRLTPTVGELENGNPTPSNPSVAGDLKETSTGGEGNAERSHEVKSNRGRKQSSKHTSLLATPKNRTISSSRRTPSAGISGGLSTCNASTKEHGDLPNGVSENCSQPTDQREMSRPETTTPKRKRAKDQCGNDKSRASSPEWTPGRHTLGSISRSRTGIASRTRSCTRSAASSPAPKRAGYSSPLSTESESTESDVEDIAWCAERTQEWVRNTSTLVLNMDTRPPSARIADMKRVNAGPPPPAKSGGCRGKKPKTERKSTKSKTAVHSLHPSLQSTSAKSLKPAVQPRNSSSRRSAADTSGSPYPKAADQSRDSFSHRSVADTSTKSPCPAVQTRNSSSHQSDADPSTKCPNRKAADQSRGSSCHGGVPDKTAKSRNRTVHTRSSTSSRRAADTSGKSANLKAADQSKVSILNQSASTAGKNLRPKSASKARLTPSAEIQLPGSQLFHKHLLSKFRRAKQSNNYISLQPALTSAVTNSREISVVTNSRSSPTRSIVTVHLSPDEDEEEEVDTDLPFKYLWNTMRSDLKIQFQVLVDALKLADKEVKSYISDYNFIENLELDDNRETEFKRILDSFLFRFKSFYAAIQRSIFALVPVLPQKHLYVVLQKRLDILKIDLKVSETLIGFKELHGAVEGRTSSSPIQALSSEAKFLSDSQTAARILNIQIFKQRTCDTGTCSIKTNVPTDSPAPSWLPSRCDVCGECSKFVCSGCNLKKYCSASCQEQHWSIHKKFCGARSQLGSI